MKSQQTNFKQTEIGMIPEDWEVKIIGDLVKIDEDTINKNYNEANIEYIDTSSVDKGHLVETQKLKLEEAPSRAKRIIKDNDILISTVRPNLKHFFFVKKSKKDLVGSTGFAVISAKKINPEFLYYYLTTENYTNFLTAIADAHTSTYPSFNPDVIETSFCPFPEETEQSAIAKILSDLDSKTELNQQMNKTLEAIGQAIFKHWFVDFEFPNEKGKPYKSSGGAMVDSELGKIPKGWKVGKLNEITSLIRDGTHNPPKRIIEGIPLITGNNVNDGFVQYSNITYISQEDYYRIHKRYAPEKGDLLITKIGTVGKVGIIRDCDLPIAIHCNVALIRPNYEIMKGIYLYWLFKSKYFLSQFHLKKNQTVQEFINLEQIGDLDVIIPNSKIILLFEHTAQIIFDKISLLNVENQNLSQIRDSLLPRLMSGKIRVPVEVRR